jgi:hypothetical protein
MRAPPPPALVRWRFASRLCLLALSLFALALLGCASSPSTAVHDWTLEVDGRAPRAVKLYDDLGPYLPATPARFVLRTNMAIPPEVRGRELSLTLPWARSLATLRVGDETIEPLELWPFDVVRPGGFELVFRIPARLTDGVSLPVALEVMHFDTLSGYVSAPRLAVSAYGDARAARAVNMAAIIGILFVCLVVGAGCLVVFLFQRGRLADGYGALMALGVFVFHLGKLGVTQIVDAHDDVHVPIVATTLLCLCGPSFAHAYFSRGRPPGVLLVVLAALGAAQLVLAWPPFAPLAIPAALIDVQIVTAIAYLLWFLQRELRGPLRVDAASMMVTWILVGVSGVLEIYDNVALAPFAWLIFVIVQATLLVRTHSRSLHALNLELESRVALLERSNREVASLNDELRRQIGDRSARLAEALARVGRLPGGPEPFATASMVGDRYRVVRPLGEGAMGAVYEVERTSDGKHFALKTVTQATSGGSLARLAREAEAASKVVHPNVVGIVDIDVDLSGILFLVMDLVEGRTLGEESAHYGDLTWARAILRQVAAGLGALHAAGVVHRDLKPSNVLLEGGGAAPRARIADFGIARIGGTTERDVDPEARTLAPLGSANPGDANLTQTGVILGTPLYMAPELARGAKDAAPSCDLWSFGVMAFEIATGRPPFAVPPLQDAMAKGRWSARPIDTRGLPEAFAEMVVRCLDGEPKRRPSAAELEASLAAMGA